MQMIEGNIAEIIFRNEENGYKLQHYKGYNFYKENPSLSIWEIIGKILFECGIVRSL